MEETTGWRTASYTTGQGNCVEVGTAGGAILVRDTKNRAAGSLSLSPAAWRRFASAVRTMPLPANRRT